MKQAKRKNEQFLSQSRRDLLASCLVIISAFVVAFNLTAFRAKAVAALLVIDTVYALIAWGIFLLLSSRSRSQTLLQLMTLVGVVSAAVSIFLIWAVFTFQI